MSEIIATEFIYVDETFKHKGFSKSLGTSKLYINFENEKGEHKSLPINEEYAADELNIEEIEIEGSDFKKYALIYTRV